MALRTPPHHSSVAGNLSAREADLALLLAVRGASGKELRYSSDAQKKEGYLAQISRVSAGQTRSGWQVAARSVSAAYRNSDAK
jgi:hypothetical protein